MIDVAAYAEEFQETGAVVIPSLVPIELIARVRAELPALLAESGPHIFMETDGQAVRAVYGLHQRDGVWRELAEEPALRALIDAIYGEPYYVFQWKINPKAPKGGERWEWHRDFTYWGAEDNMPEPKALTVAILISDVAEESGPTVVIKNSHRLPLSDTERGQIGGWDRADGDENTDWSRLVSNGLPYVIHDDEADRLSRQHGAVIGAGPAGTALIFHSNSIHGSLPNVSATTRVVALLTFNPLSNAPSVASQRPDYFVNRYPVA